MKTLLSLTACMVLGIATAEAKDEETAPAPAPAGPVILYDTAEPANAGDTVPSIVGEAWKKVDGDAAIQGDAALTNGALAALVRKDGSGVDVYAKGADGWTRRIRLAPAAGDDTVKIGALQAAPAGDDGSKAVEATLAGGSIVFSMKPGEPILRAAPKGTAEALRFTAPCRLGIMPDFFGDDLMIDAAKVAVERTEVPSENIFLYMIPGGDAIVAATWEKNEKDMVVRLSSEGENRVMESTDVFFAGGSICAVVLEGKGMWFARNFTREEGLKGVRITEWDVPFEAKWKGNFEREDRRIESIPFAPGRDGGIESKGGKLTACIGRNSRLGAQEHEREANSDKYVGLTGLGVIYPLTRTEQTPLDRLCVDDLLRLCLGTGPCESILDLAARQPQSKGIFTCSYGGMFKRVLPSIRWREREMTQRVKDERYFLRRYNRNMMTFVTNVQNRINGYVDFGLEMLAYLDEQQKAHPGLSDFIDRIKAEWAIPVPQYARPKAFANTEHSTNEKRARAYLEPFQKALQIDTPEQLAKGRGGAGTIPNVIGDPGDRRLRNLRRKVKVIRAMATMETATNPAAVDIAKKIRDMTATVLRNPHSYEKVTVW